MNLEIAKTLVDIDEYLDLKVRENYSGRGMYGSETTGIIAHSYSDFILAVTTHAYRLGTANKLEDLYEVQNFLENMKQDNMGRQIIIY